jgi:hypothetical protein
MQASEMTLMSLLTRWLRDRHHKYSVKFHKFSVEIFLNNFLICRGHLNNDLYVLKPTNSSLYHIESNKCIKLSLTNETFLWNLRLSHIDLNKIQKLIKESLLGDLKVEPFQVCKSCLDGKMTKRAFPSKENIVKEVWELVHSDVCGPINVQVRGGYEYFSTFTMINQDIDIYT